MFSVGQKVLYGVNGVCCIDDIIEKCVGGVNMEYYVLTPISSASSTLFVPTGNQALVSKIRSILSADEINEIINHLPDGGVWNDNKIERAEAFKAIVASGDCLELVRLIRLISSHESEQKKRGKHLHLTDERILKEAEKMVIDEISLVLEIERDKVIPLILD